MARGWTGPLAIWLAAAAAMAPGLAAGLPVGDSHLFNMSWSYGFAEELAAGTPYPRWLASLWQGAGAPDFYFYAPLPFWIGAVIALLPGVGPEAAITLGAFLLLGASGVAMRGLALRLALPGPAAAAGVAWILMPYHLGNWFDRQAIGEFTAMSILPFLLAALLDTLDGRRLAAVRLALWGALLILAHLPSVIMAACLLPAVCLVAVRPLRPAGIGAAALGSALALAVSAVYWLPALMLIDPASADYLRGIFWWEHMLKPAELASWQRHPDHWVPFALMSAAAAAVLALGRLPARATRLAAGLAIGVWVFATPVSMLLWAHTPLGIVQFPSRFVMFAELAFALLVPPLLAGLPAGRLRRAGLFLAFAVGLAALLLENPHLRGWRRATYDFTDQVAARPGAVEWLPAPAREAMLEAGLRGYTARLGTGRPLIAPPEGIAVTAEHAREIRFDAAPAAPMEVTFRRTAWRHWQLRDAATGARIPLGAAPETGLLTATLPAGERSYLLELPLLGPERAGLAVSGAGLAGTLLLAILTLRRRPRSAPRPRAAAS